MIEETLLRRGMKLYGAVLMALLFAFVPKVCADEQAFTLGTDTKGNPLISGAYYRIGIARTVGTTLLEVNGDNVKVASAKTNLPSQAWQITYAGAQGDASRISMYIANPEKGYLGATSAANASGAVSCNNAASGAMLLTISGPNTLSSVEHWNLQTTISGTTNYFSNNSGPTYNMGFWNGTPTTDAGSNFSFTRLYEVKFNVEAENGMDNVADIGGTVDGTNFGKVLYIPSGMSSLSLAISPGSEVKSVSATIGGVQYASLDAIAKALATIADNVTIDLKIAQNWTSAYNEMLASATTYYNGLDTKNAGKVGYVKKSLVDALAVFINKGELTSASQSDYTALSSAFSAIKSSDNILYPENGKVYTLRSVNAYNNSSSTPSPMYLCDNTTAAGSALTVSSAMPQPSSVCYFTFNSTSTEHQYNLMNVQTSRYLNNKKSEATSETTLFQANGDGTFSFKMVSQNWYLAMANGNIDRWSSIVDGAKWVITEIAGYKLTVKSKPALADGEFSWNGEVLQGKSVIFNVLGGETISSPSVEAKALNDTYSFSGFTDEQGNALTSADYNGDADKTIVANFSENFFSKTYGEKWLHVSFASNSSFCWTLDKADNYSGKQPYNRAADISADNKLWCFVGTASSFKIYNKVAGEDLALTSSTVISDGTTTSMTASANAVSWKLGTDYIASASAAGYTFAPASASTSMAINSYGGTNAPLSYWNASGDGSHWTVEDASAKFNLSLDGLDADIFSETVSRVGKLKVNYGLSSSTANIDVNSFSSPMTCYIPGGSSVTCSVSDIYYGFSFSGFTYGDKTNVETFTEKLTSDGLSVKANFSYDSEDGNRYIFYDKDSYGVPYRIPAITTAKNGNVIAVSDRRYCGSDIGNGHIDIVGRVSKDNGRSWSSDFILMDGTGKSGAADCGYGDAAIVADREINRVLVIACAGNVNYPNSTYASPLRTVRQYGSLVDGEWVWEAPVDITNDIYTTLLKGNANKLFFGSGRICQSSKVKVGNYYRLYTAILTSGSALGGEGNMVLYSDDFGKTWNVLGSASSLCCVGGNEPKVEELPDGNVVLSSRKYYGRYFNVFSFTDAASATGSWSTAVQSNQVTGGISFGGNSCNGEIYMVPAVRVSDKASVVLALQSIPTADSRSNVKIYYKELSSLSDYNTPSAFATSWDGSYQVVYGGSAYSTMTLQANGEIGFIWEDNHQPAGGNYDIVYRPISISTITSGAYTYQVPTGISTVVTSEKDNKIFDLSGRALNKINSFGTYIINGKTVVKH